MEGIYSDGFSVVKYADRQQLCKQKIKNSPYNFTYKRQAPNFMNSLE